MSGRKWRRRRRRRGWRSRRSSARKISIRTPRFTYWRGWRRSYLVFVVLLCNKLWLDCKLFLQIIDLESQGRDLIILVSKTLKGTICNELSIDLCISALPSSSETRVNRFQSTLEIHSFLFFDGSSRLKLADLVIILLTYTVSSTSEYLPVL